MRKDKLIKLLQDIPGNPDVVIWNGLVGDWMDVGELAPTQLVKESREFVSDALLAEDGLKRQDLTEEQIQQHAKELDHAMTYRKWELPNPYVEPEDMKKWYGTRRKNIVLISPKIKGETYGDRLGTISY